MGKKEKKSKEPPLPAIDKSFYELQIADLNAKLATLRHVTAEIEEKNIELEQKYVKLDEDRADVIAYLKRTLQEKVIEIADLMEKLTTLQEAKDEEDKIFQVKYSNLKNEMKMMREQLTGEIKLLTGKLNTLDEFRTQRDDLMQRFEQQEKTLEEQEVRHKQILYEVEKKFILGKDAIKKGMENQVRQLGADFARYNDLRIAATTQSAIRQNITINNELNGVIAINERLENENFDLKMKNKNLQLNFELYTTERDKAVKNATVQRYFIDKLTREHKKITDTLIANTSIIEAGCQNEKKLIETKERIEKINYKLRLLEQNLHATRCQEVTLQNNIQSSYNYIDKYRGLMFQAANSIKSALKAQTEPNLEESVKIYQRESLLANLLSLLTLPKEELVGSVSATYVKGDLGIIPKVRSQKRARQMRITRDTQIGASLENLKLFVESSKEYSSSEETEIGDGVDRAGIEDKVSESSKSSSEGAESAESITRARKSAEEIEGEEIEEEYEAEFELKQYRELYGEVDYDIQQHQALLRAIEQGDGYIIDDDV